MIVDAKRGDIGSTMGAYADAFLRDGSPLAGDALTVSPYLGFGSLDPAVDLALATGRGLFVLCLTSNKEGHEVQHARTDGRRHGGRARGRAGRGAERRTPSPLGLDRARRGRDDRRRGASARASTWPPSTARCSRPASVRRARGRASSRRCSAPHAGRCWRRRRAACSPPGPTSRPLRSRCPTRRRRGGRGARPELDGRGVAAGPGALDARPHCRSGWCSLVSLLTIPRTSTWVAGPLTRR